jgi:hypothetical protein
MKLFFTASLAFVLLGCPQEVKTVEKDVVTGLEAEQVACALTQLANGTTAAEVVAVACQIPNLLLPPLQALLQGSTTATARLRARKASP